ncbi:hypothetical protein J7L68_03400 [bacterium]|nr:hypothetical protein [bacterium]
MSIKRKRKEALGICERFFPFRSYALRYNWTSEEVDSKLKGIMQSIHQNCVKYGKKDDFVNYVDGANIAGFVKVANAMIAQGLV